MLTKLCSFVGATVLGTLGWYVGERAGMMTAFILSMIGTGVGMYYGVKVARHYGI